MVSFHSATHEGVRYLSIDAIDVLCVSENDLAWLVTGLSNVIC